MVVAVEDGVQVVVVAVGGGARKEILLRGQAVEMMPLKIDQWK